MTGKYKYVHTSFDVYFVIYNQKPHHDFLKRRVGREARRP